MRDCPGKTRLVGTAACFLKNGHAEARRRGRLTAKTPSRQEAEGKFGSERHREHGRRMARPWRAILFLACCPGLNPGLGGCLPPRLRVNHFSAHEERESGDS